jgi:alpha-ketoglutarate-dependent taurine dioxygenase
VLSTWGGETEFANTYAAYEALSDGDKALIDSLKVVHSKRATMEKSYPDPTPEQAAHWTSFAPKTHPLVWRHRSGRRSLFLSTSSDYVIGMDKAEGDALLARLLDWATQPRFVYRHSWRMGDVLIWDNTGTMHRVRPYDLESRRRLHRVTLMGEEAVA